MPSRERCRICAVTSVNGIGQQCNTAYLDRCQEPSRDAIDWLVVMVALGVGTGEETVGAGRLSSVEKSDW
jgi:hypothetical protein